MEPPIPFNYYMALVYFVIALLEVIVMYLFKATNCGWIIVPLKHVPAQSVRGNEVASSRLVVFSKSGTGFANNMMGLLSSYAAAIALDAPLAGNSHLSVICSRAGLSIQ